MFCLSKYMVAVAFYLTSNVIGMALFFVPAVSSYIETSTWRICNILSWWCQVWSFTLLMSRTCFCLRFVVNIRNWSQLNTLLCYLIFQHLSQPKFPKKNIFPSIELLISFLYCTMTYRSRAWALYLNEVLIYSRRCVQAPSYVGRGMHEGQVPLLK